MRERIPGEFSGLTEDSKEYGKRKVEYSWSGEGEKLFEKYRKTLRNLLSKAYEDISNFEEDEIDGCTLTALSEHTHEYFKFSTPEDGVFFVKHYEGDSIGQGGAPEVKSTLSLKEKLEQLKETRKDLEFMQVIEPLFGYSYENKKYYRNGNDKQVKVFVSRYNEEIGKTIPSYMLGASEGNIYTDISSLKNAGSAANKYYPWWQYVDTDEKLVEMLDDVTKKFETMRSVMGKDFYDVKGNWNYDPKSGKFLIYDINLKFKEEN